jgi:hypothetical protein
MGCAVEVHGSREAKETKGTKENRESQKSEYFNRIGHCRLYTKNNCRTTLNGSWLYGGHSN